MPQRDLRSCPKIALDNNRPLASNVFILCVYVFGTKCAMLIIVEVRRACLLSVAIEDRGL